MNYKRKKVINMRNKYIKNVAKIEFFKEKCTSCGRCLEVCPQAVFKKIDNKVSLVDKDFCMECGACALNCPFDAVKVKSGVGCTSAIITGWIKGTEPDCDCSGSSSSDCC